ADATSLRTDLPRVVGFWSVLKDGSCQYSKVSTDRSFKHINRLAKYSMLTHSVKHRITEHRNTQTMYQRTLPRRNTSLTSIIDKHVDIAGRVTERSQHQ